MRDFYAADGTVISTCFCSRLHRLFLQDVYNISFIVILQGRTKHHEYMLNAGFEKCSW